MKSHRLGTPDFSVSAPKVERKSHESLFYQLNRRLQSGMYRLQPILVENARQQMEFRALSDRYLVFVISRELLDRSYRNFVGYQAT